MNQSTLNSDMAILVPQHTSGLNGIHVCSIYNTCSHKANALEREIENIANREKTIPEADALMIEYIRTKDLRFLQQANALIEKHNAMIRIEYLDAVKELERIAKVREYTRKNKIAEAGRAAVIGRLVNITTYTGIINYGTLGTSSTAFSNSQTQLVAEVFRKTAASSSQTTKTGFIDFFYSKADTNGTYQEFGTAIDGTASANTGQLFTRMLTGGWTKSASESMTVACQYDLNDDTP